MRKSFLLSFVLLFLFGCAGTQNSNIGKDLGDLSNTEAYTPTSSGSGVYWSAQKDVINANFAALDTKNDSQDTLIALNTDKVGLTTDSVTPLMLVSDNALVDEYCVTYEASTGNFEMQVCGSGAGDDLGSATYSDVVALWTTCTSGLLAYDGTCVEITQAYLESLLDGADLTPDSVTLTAVSEPGGGFVDADSGDEDQTIARFWADATTTTAGSVISDVGLTYKDGDDASGSDTDFLIMDGSEGTLFIYVPTEVPVKQAVKHVTTSTYTIGTDDIRECYGGMIYVDAASTVTTCDDLAEGMATTVEQSGDFQVYIKAQSDNAIRHDDVALAMDNGDKLGSSGEAGDAAYIVYESAAQLKAFTITADGDHFTDEGQ